MQIIGLMLAFLSLVAQYPLRGRLRRVFPRRKSAMGEPSAFFTVSRTGTRGDDRLQTKRVSPVARTAATKTIQRTRDLRGTSPLCQQRRADIAALSLQLTHTQPKIR